MYFICQTCYILDVNECTELSYSVCLNGGFCINLSGNYTCQCPPGFTGHRCGIGKSLFMIELVFM